MNVDPNSAARHAHGDRQMGTVSRAAGTGRYRPSHRVRARAAMSTVCRAIIASSLVGMTHAFSRPAEALIRLAPRALASASRRDRSRTAPRGPRSGSRARSRRCPRCDDYASAAAVVVTRGRLQHHNLPLSRHLHRIAALSSWSAAGSQLHRNRPPIFALP